jgi:arylsulfatase A-like enzyme
VHPASRAALFAILALAACHTRSTEQRNVLVIDVDTLRNDRVGASRDGQPLTPVLDALAARGTRFDLTVAQSGWTLPSLASLLTGNLTGGALQDVESKDVAWIPPHVRTVPQILALYGYETAVFYGRTIPLRIPDYHHGFDFVAPAPAPKDRSHPNHAFLDWLADDPQEPWFALVHTVDMHMLADVPRPDLHRFARQPHEPCVTPEMNYDGLIDKWSSTLGRPAAEELARAHYDGAVAYEDRKIGEMLEALGSARNDTVIVFLSDHGEELFEHGRLDHGAPYEFVLRIPLVVSDPARPSAPRNVSEMVETIDVAPTILELAGVPTDATMAGRSLVPFLDGTVTTRESRSVLSITDPFRLSLRTPTRHLVRCSEPGCPKVGGSRSVLELYDPVADPAERADLSATSPEEITALAAELEMRVATVATGRRPVGGELSEEARKTLRERGYWEHIDGAGSGSAAAQTSERIPGDRGSHPGEPR